MRTCRNDCRRSEACSSSASSSWSPTARRRLPSSRQWRWKRDRRKAKQVGVRIALPDAGTSSTRELRLGAIDPILTINLVASTAIFFVAARLYVLPNVHRWGFRRVMAPILLLHSFRHLGLMFLTRGATYAGMPPQFAYPAAMGDLLAAMLALVALGAVVRDRPAARALVWVFNLEGTVDLLNAIALSTLYGAPVYMGPAYWIPAFWVPALLVTHYVTFVVLLSTRDGATAAAR